MPSTLAAAHRAIGAELARHDLCFGHGTDNAFDEAGALLMGALHLDYDALGQPRQLSRDERERLAALLKRRIVERVPLPYLVGEAWFAGLRFIVDESVLVPRSPIAELIDGAFAPWLIGEPEEVLDLCAGSGCIGIACALAFPEATVTLTDVSDAAVAVARRNVELHRVADRVEVLRGDLFAPVGDRRFDLIVCNPPYVDAQDLHMLPDEFRHEPVLGLAGGDDGLDFVRRIMARAPHHLTERGLLVCEVGNSADALLRAYPTVPFIWPDFERGGGGVFVVEAATLRSRASP